MTYQKMGKISRRALTRNMNRSKMRLKWKQLVLHGLTRAIKCSRFGIVAKNFRPSSRRSLKITARRRVYKKRRQRLRRICAKTKLQMQITQSRMSVIQVTPSKRMIQIWFIARPSTERIEQEETGNISPTRSSTLTRSSPSIDNHSKLEARAQIRSS